MMINNLNPEWWLENWLDDPPSNRVNTTVLHPARKREISSGD